MIPSDGKNPRNNLSVLLGLNGRRGSKDTKVATAAYLNALAHRLRRRRTRVATGTPAGRARGERDSTRLTDDVGDRLQVIGALLLRGRRQPHHVPATRRDEAGRVFLAQVVSAWLLVRGQRPEHGR